MINDILLKPQEQVKSKKDLVFKKNLEECRKKGLCPTCENQKKHNIYYDDPELVLYEDDTFVARLEQNPRRSGHAIIIVKPHYEDISQMPIDLANPFFELCQKIIHAQLEVLGAVKSYLVTMCDGGPNHLHFQLIPRYAGETHGKHVFVSERQQVKKDAVILKKLREFIKNYKVK
jgi:diadenosine tetraphosphate (Ap4A) HIT family hydrolase